MQWVTRYILYNSIINSGASQQRSRPGVSAETNLFHLFQQQIRIIASFGAASGKLAESMHKMAIGEALPVIDSEIPLSEFDKGLKRVADRAVGSGKIIVSSLGRPGEKRLRAPGPPQSLPWSGAGPISSSVRLNRRDHSYLVVHRVHGPRAGPTSPSHPQWPAPISSATLDEMDPRHRLLGQRWPPADEVDQRIIGKDRTWLGLQEQLGRFQSPPSPRSQSRSHVHRRARPRWVFAGATHSTGRRPSPGS